eukprot:2296791-Pleurochrysis_carterae.AAC.1
MTTVGTRGTSTSSPAARARSAATAASAATHHACTRSAYTPGAKRSATAMGPCGRPPSRSSLASSAS